MLSINSANKYHVINKEDKVMNVYEKITQTIIEQIDKGIIPWQRPWTGTADGAINYVTRRPYSLLSL